MKKIFSFSNRNGCQWTRENNLKTIRLLTKKTLVFKIKVNVCLGVLNAEIAVKYISNNTSCSNHKAVSSLLDSEVQFSTLQEN